MAYKRKKRGTTIILALLTGYLGIHRFYLGDLFYGLFYLLTCGGFGIFWLYDVLYFLVMSDQDFDKEYNQSATKTGYTLEKTHAVENKLKQTNYILSSSKDPVEQLVELNKLYEKGMISFEEFEYLKKQILK